MSKWKVTDDVDLFYFTMEIFLILFCSDSRQDFVWSDQRIFSRYKLSHPINSHVQADQCNNNIKKYLDIRQSIMPLSIASPW